MRSTPSQSPAEAGAVAAALFMLAAHVASKATRDALFLSLFPVTDLPRAMIAAALVSLLSAVVMSRLLARIGPFRVVPAAFALSALLFAGEWLLLSAAPGVATVALYLHSAAFGALLISAFWSVANERFDPHAGKPTFARIGSFAALGGVVGGLVAGPLSALLGVPAMLLVLCALHLGCAAAILGIGGAPAARAAAAPEPRGPSALRQLRQRPLLLQMGALVAVLAIVDSLLDYALKSEAAASLVGREALIRFFAIFYTTVGLVGFGLQASLGPRVLRGLGLGGAMALTPSVVLLAGGMASAFARLWTVALVRGAAFATAHSFFRSGFELLYTPLPPATKRPTKAYVDVGAQRLGDLVGGGSILALLALVPGLPTSLILALAACAAAVALWLVVRLHHGYVQALGESLRSGTLRLGESEELDATTARTLAGSRVTIDRAELLVRIRELQRAQGARAPQHHVATDAAAPAAPVELATFFERVSALASGDPARARAALAEARDELALVPHVLPLLAGFDLREDALDFLRRAAPRAVGQLGDALLDPAQSVLVRRSLPSALEAAPSARAMDVLCRGLEDPDFDVRLHCGRAAAHLLARQPALRPAPEIAWAAVARELAVDARSWEHQGRRRDESHAGSVLLDASSLASVNRSLEHVFTLFALALDPELMGFALRGLHAGDAGLRGTALEYLEATLPEAVRRALWPRLHGAEAPARPKRATAEIAEELLRSSTSIRFARRDR
jgi:hypothetical protein